MCATTPVGAYTRVNSKKSFDELFPELKEEKQSYEEFTVCVSIQKRRTKQRINCIFHTTHYRLYTRCMRRISSLKRKEELNYLLKFVLVYKKWFISALLLTRTNLQSGPCRNRDMKSSFARFIEQCIIYISYGNTNINIVMTKGPVKLFTGFGKFMRILLLRC